MYRHQRLWNVSIFYPPSEVTGLFVYELHIEGTHTAMYRHQRLWNVSIFYPPAEVTGLFVYELHIEGIVQYFRSFIR